MKEDVISNGIYTMSDHGIYELFVLVSIIVP